MEESVFSMFGPMFDQMGFLIYIILFVALFGGAAFFLWRAGFFIKRPIKVIMFLPRANGSFELRNCKGRFMDNGKFEINYGINTNTITNAPSEDYIQYGNTIYFTRIDRDTPLPCRVVLSSEKLQVDPAITNAGKLALGNEIIESSERFSLPNPLQQYFPYIAIIIGALIIGAALYFALGSVAGSLDKVASKFDTIAARIPAQTTSIPITQTVPQQTVVPSTPAINYTKPGFGIVPAG